MIAGAGIVFAPILGPIAGVALRGRKAERMLFPIQAGALPQGSLFPRRMAGADR
jgi:hypothetical protein